MYVLKPEQKEAIEHLLKGVPYTLSDNRIMQNYLAFSHIMGNSKQDFTFTKKSKFEFTWT